MTLAGAVAAVSLRNLVHCALALAMTFAGLAAFYLQLNAQFVGFAQVLIYIGAVAILIVFAILLTGGSEPAAQSRFSNGWIIGVLIATLVFGLIGTAVLKSGITRRAPAASTEVGVRQIGEQLMHKYVLPLEITGLLLTGALIGAVIIAMREKASPANVPDRGHA